MAEQKEESVKDSKEKNKSDQVSRWLKELKLSSEHEENWRKSGNDVVDLYRDEKRASEDRDGSSRFNILFSNTEVLKGALYSNTPIPDCRRRFAIKDTIGKKAAQVLQRALSYTLDEYDFDEVMTSAIEDSLLPGRGHARVKYKPTFAKIPTRMPYSLTHEEEMNIAMGLPEGVQQDEQGMFKMEQIEQVVYEEVYAEYIEWEFFRYSPAKRWKKVRWVAFGELMTKDEVKKQFGAKMAENIKYDYTAKNDESDEDDGTESKQHFKRALIWAIWNKKNRKVYVVCSSYRDDFVAVWDDPLKLEGFFPCPRPIYDIKTTNSLIPVPNYRTYQDHADQLDDITERIRILIDALRRRGVRDASIPELEELANAGDNTFVPVDNYAEFVEKGGLQSAFQESDISNLAEVILELRAQAEAKKQDIYEIIGISDIMRGSSNPNETKGAQEIKNQWGSIRTNPRSREVQRFARDLFRLKAELMAEHFTVDMFKMMTGMNMSEEEWKQVKEILKSDKLRGFIVKIETDSTIQPNADKEQKNRVELLQAATKMMQELAPAVQGGQMPMKVAIGMIMFGIRAFKVGPELEDILDEWVEQQEQAMEGGEQGGEDPQKAMQEQELQRQQQMQQQEEEAAAQHANALRAIELETAKAKMIKEKATAYKAVVEGEALIQGEQLTMLQNELGLGPSTETAQ